MSSLISARPALKTVRRLALWRQPRDARVRSSHSASTPKTSLTLDDVLVPQDPYRRIQFSRPLHLLGTASTHEKRLREYARAFARNGVTGAAPYVLPFWVLHFVFDQSIALHIFTNNMADYVDTPQRYQSEMSFSVAAVPEGHWASGAFTPQTARLLTETHPHLSSRISPIEFFLPSQSPTIYSRPGGGVQPFAPNGWDPDTAPTFSLSPPRFTNGEMEKIIGLQATSSADWNEIMKPRGIKVFAIPQYRLVYKVFKGNGTLGMFDATSPIIGYNTFDITWLKGKIRPVDEDLHLTMRYRARYLNGDGNLDPHIVQNYNYIPKPKLDTLISTVFGAMKRRGPMTAEMWEDERILPEIGPMKDGNAQSLINYSDDAILGIGRVEEPYYPIKQKGSGPASSNLFAARAAPKKTKRAIPSTGPSPSADEAEAEDRPMFRYGASTLDKRRAYIRERARLAQEEVRKSIGRSESGTRPRYPAVLPDPKGYYGRLLDDVPGPDFLDPTKMQAIDRLISAKFKEQSLAVHPDMGGSGEEFIKLREARQQIGTFMKRLDYYSKSK